MRCARHFLFKTSEILDHYYLRTETVFATMSDPPSNKLQILVQSTAQCSALHRTAGRFSEDGHLTDLMSFEF